MSETPRTDAARIDNSDLTDWGRGKSDYVYADFAEQLERELADSKKLAAEYSHDWNVTALERNELRDQLAKCKQALGKAVM